MDKPISHYIQGLIMDTENAARHIDTKIFITLAHNKIQQITQNTTNFLHKTQLHIIKQICKKLIK